MQLLLLGVAGNGTASGLFDSDWSTFLPDVVGGAIGGVLGFLFAYLLLRREWSHASKEEKASEEERRIAFLSYLASEIRSNRDFLLAMKRYVQARYKEPYKHLQKNYRPYIKSGLSEAAYRRVAPEPEAAVAKHPTLRDRLVDSYSGIPVWQQLEVSLERETANGDPDRALAAMKQVADAYDALDGQVVIQNELLAALESLGIRTGSRNSIPA